MKIAIVFPCGHLTSTPCIPSLAILLAKRGCKVDIYTAENKTTVTENSFSIFDDIDNLNLYVYPVKLKSFFENIPLLLLGFIPWWFYKSVTKKYDFIIAAGVRALFMVGTYSLFKKGKFVYLSLELYFKEEKRSWSGRLFKYLEGFFNRRAEMSIIQDELRAKVLQRENRVRLDSVLFFPNSYLPVQLAIRRNTVVEHLSIQKKKIALCAGSIIEPWTMVDDLIKESMRFPAGWVLLLHSKMDLSKVNWAQAHKLKAYNRVVLSTKPLSEADYEELVRSVHIGIALYDIKENKNLYYMGFSSGKIAQYLKCGKPVIINDLPLIGKIVKDFKCGVLVNKIQEVKDAIKEIEDNYESFSKNAFYMYEHFLNPESYVEGIIKKLFYSST